LRLSVYQLMYMDRIPGYSIVNEAVNIAKQQVGLQASKFVNAVLRKIARIDDPAGFTDSSIDEKISDENQKLGLKKSFPLWLVKYWSGMYGCKITGDLLESFNRPSINYIRINKLVTDKKKLAGLFAKNGLVDGRDFDTLSDERNKGMVFKDAMVLKSLQNIKKTIGYDRGLFSIQDYSSQFVVRHFLKPAPHERILDLCGAPGGKATYTAEIAKNLCEVISVDINEEKIKLFEENIKRLKIKNVSIVISDVTGKDYLDYDNYFDKVFIDSPCSALGTISRNPDVKYNKSMDDIKRLSSRSLKIINNCKRYLNRKKGKIIYYTCTLSRIENQDVINRFIGENSSSFGVRYASLPAFFYRYFKENGIEPGNDGAFFDIMPYCFNSEVGFIAEIYKK